MQPAPQARAEPFKRAARGAGIMLRAIAGRPRIHGARPINMVHGRVARTTALRSPRRFQKRMGPSGLMPGQDGHGEFTSCRKDWAANERAALANHAEKAR